MRTGIRSGVAAKYVKHLYETTPDGKRKALGGHRLGRWSPIEAYTVTLNLDALDAAFRSQGGDGLCKSCRGVAEVRARKAVIQNLPKEERSDKDR